MATDTNVAAPVTFIVPTVASFTVALDTTDSDDVVTLLSTVTLDACAPPVESDGTHVMPVVPSIECTTPDGPVIVNDPAAPPTALLYAREPAAFWRTLGPLTVSVGVATLPLNAWWPAYVASPDARSMVCSVPPALVRAYTPPDTDDVSVPSSTKVPSSAATPPTVSDAVLSAPVCVCSAGPVSSRRS